MEEQNSIQKTVVKDKEKKLSQEDQEIIRDIDKLQISKEQKQEIIATMEMYTGPIPHPKILAGYQALYPKAAEKIINNGIEEASHRRKLESERQKRRGRLAWFSSCSLFIFMIIFIISSFILILKGHPISGSIFAGTSFILFLSTMYSGILQLSDNNDRESSKNKHNDKND